MASASEETVDIGGVKVRVRRFDTVVVGSGAAGLNAADYLRRHGQKDVALVSEGLIMGTSRNTGSDKQTYYKLSLGGDAVDSVRQTARTLFAGGAMDGDIAMAEAAASAQCFYRLVDIGVPFPHNAYGEYVGYKTDHDPAARGSSCGPLTSKFMTERLLQAARDAGVAIFNGFQVIEILVAGVGADRETCGVLALNLNLIDNRDTRYVLFAATNVVYATGGEAGMYEASVYPASQIGSTGVALRAGVPGKNLTESQYGITSVQFRWNLSGTYQQVLPRYLSTDPDGGDEREFLNDHFPDPGALLGAVFLKGYQWPFDPRKIAGNGSSTIDLLVHNEIAFKGRRVFLDYTRNPDCAAPDGVMDFSLLPEEARTYLENSGALFGTPVERLEKMNPEAIALYARHGIDLHESMLEIAVSAQHANGGLAADMWWQSEIRGLFPVGEVNGSHGVYRPGGSALNSGQVGGLRAGQYILNRRTHPAPQTAAILERCGAQIADCIDFGERALARKEETPLLAEEIRDLRHRMSRHGAHIRSPEGVAAALAEASAQLARLDAAGIDMAVKLRTLHQVRDLVVCHFVYLWAIRDYIENGGGSRGSYLIHNPEGELPHPALPKVFAHTLDDGSLSGKIQEITFDGKDCQCRWRDVRPLPTTNDWFETTWRDFVDGNIYTPPATH